LYVLLRTEKVESSRRNVLLPHCGQEGGVSEKVGEYNISLRWHWRHQYS
jgi:hypothetical protein